MSQLHRILYCSRNSILGTSEDVAADIHKILAVSRVNNARDNVTGGLLFSTGCFAQVLEGPLDTIETIFERIQCDERHSNVVVLRSEPIKVRDFPAWSMAFTGSDAANNPLAGMALPEILSGRSTSGNDLLDTLKSVVVRETEWLAP